MILNKAQVAEFFVGLSAAWTAAYKRLIARTPVWQKIAMELPSTTAENLYPWLSRWPKVRKWVAERYLKSLALNGYRLRNEPYEASITVKLDELADDVAGMYAVTVKQGWPDAVAKFLDRNVFSLLANGNSATLGLCFDGTAFFNANHPLTSSEGVTAVQSNVISGAGAAWYLLDCSDEMKPLIVQKRQDFEFAAVYDKSDGQVFKTKEGMFGVDGRYAFGYGFWQKALRSTATLDTAGFNAAFAQMGSLLDEEGEPIGVTPTTLVCGMSNRAAALATINSEKLADNTTNPNYKAVEVIVVPWLP